MGTVYAIANQKGGVGKTTTAVNVAACIAEAGYPTLLVDVDPQANATVGARPLEAPRPEPLRRPARRGRRPTRRSCPPRSRASRSLPASPDLAASSVELPREGASEGRLRDALAPVRDRFDYVLLDCPPRSDPLTLNALVAADRVIVPVQTEYFALEGFAGLLDTLALVQRELNPRLAVAGMLLTMHDGRTRLARDVEHEVREHFPDLVFDTVIPRNVRISEAPSLRPPRDPPRPALVRCGRVLRARQGGGAAWLKPAAAWVGAWPRSWPCPTREPRSGPSCGSSRSS